MTDILERAKAALGSWEGCEYDHCKLPDAVEELITEVEANQIMLRQFQVHEDQTHAAMEKIVGNSDNFVELTRQMKAEIERLRSENARAERAHESLDYMRRHEIASLNARIKELDADRIAYRNLGSRIEDLETYIERLEAAFLEVTEAFEWEGIDGDMNRDDCRKRASEALERIKEGGKDE